MTSADSDPGRVLSIQSHVAYGYVASSLPLPASSRLAHSLKNVNTVDFSNHSGYNRMGGTKATAEELERMFSVMEQNGLLRPTRILTGFIFGAEALSIVARTVTKLLQNDPNIVYLLDPVMGDANRLYVSRDVIPLYRSLLTKASIITPNWFEVETLTDTKIEDGASLHKALTILHETYSVPNVVIISDHEQSLLCLASVRATDDGGSSTPSHRPSTVYAACVPLISGYFSGVGDLFSALVLGHYDASSPPAPLPPLPRAVSLALTKTHAILRLTEKYASSLPPDERTTTDDELDEKDPERRIRRMRGRELRLVQGRKILSGRPWVR
ncbi:Ribokinase-like protein [Russula vinacea]|nr:Ribokinase-like protein [Russula vinacea]